MSMGSIPLAFAFLFSLALVAIFCRLAPWLGLVDAPTARKLHHGAVPVCGGLAMFLALLGALLVRHELQPAHDVEVTVAVVQRHGLVPLAGALGLLVAIGVVDDRWQMKAITKLLLQVVVAVLLLALSASDGLGLLHLPFPMPVPSWFAHLVSLVFVVGMINAFNMIDGLDGLAGGLAAIALVGLATASAMADQASLVDDSLLLFAVVLGFLALNLRRPGLPRALAFMGDAGSMMLGCAIAGLILDLSSRSGAGGNGVEAFPALLWLVALPVIDTISLMIRRPLAGRSPMAADRAHLHHLLLDMGVSPMLAAGILIGAAALLAVVGCAGVYLQLSPAMMLGGLILPAMAHCAFVWTCAQRRKELDQPLAVSSGSAE